MDKYFIVPPKDAYENRDRIMDFLDDVRCFSSEIKLR